MSFYANEARKKQRRDPTGKPIAQRKHAQRRARERWGINLTDALYNAWVAAIKGDRRDIERRCLGRETNTLTHFAITHDDREIPVVYDRKTKHIATVLPESGLLGPATGDE